MTRQLTTIGEYNVAGYPSPVYLSGVLPPGAAPADSVRFEQDAIPQLADAIGSLRDGKGVEPSLDVKDLMTWITEGDLDEDSELITHGEIFYALTDELVWSRDTLLGYAAVRGAWLFGGLGTDVRVTELVFNREVTDSAHYARLIAALLDGVLGSPAFRAADGDVFVGSDAPSQKGSRIMRGFGLDHDGGLSQFSGHLSTLRKALRGVIGTAAVAGDEWF
ncbi:MAG TPA: hypothetical protein VLE99_04495 [Candidatus Saccharimonadales bacterium]|nr:hypothetical protein [Candidatus Saccharimonadales bacterium]